MYTERYSLARLQNYLDLSNLELNEMPSIPEDLYSIDYLFINNNNLVNIDLKFFTSLRVLDIRDNKISTIDFLPLSLEELVCDNCMLTYICAHQNLKTLHCSDNLLKNISSYPSLLNLECHHNQITSIQTFPNLQKLTCGYNPLDNIEIQPLIFLDCQHTNISSIDMFDKLEIADIADTKIKKILYIKTLKNIGLNDNDIMLASKYKIASSICLDNKIDIIFRQQIFP